MTLEISQAARHALSTWLDHARTLQGRSENTLSAYRADVVDFDAFLSAVGSGRITGASDVWPEEPLRPDHPARGMTGLLRSAHRAGAMEHVFHEMGDYVLDDMDLLDRGLPPMRCRRAERETVGRLRSRPVDKS